jgi:hypothetical protein
MSVTRKLPANSDGCRLFVACWPGRGPHLARLRTLRSDFIGVIGVSDRIRGAGSTAVNREEILPSLLFPCGTPRKRFQG